MGRRPPSQRCLAKIVKNPWIALPRSGKFVLPDDLPTVTAFNRRASSNVRLRLGLLPEPFVGSPRAARVLFLQLNPGFAGNEAYWHHKPQYARMAVANLRHEASEYPYYYLDPAWKRSPGGKWNRARLAAVLNEIGADADSKVAKRLMSVEFVGYHSRSYSPIPVTLPSQHYSFWLVRRAIARGSIVVIAKGERQWKIAVPELDGYERTFVLSNPRSSYLTAAVLGKRRFEAVVAAMSR